ncbi:hypothetical protein [Lentibacillus amyloliquefaciens]|uniref:Uncharacterized protein n=1 Tax=Lentibacillus amyloliquefaciens TaxID=1472767 RepID=A0A0U4E2Z8_9BACI|nr:hypothetical protein [Lentibacillus amyloliquefaciens]ALX47644.1 hypothetical protein AOX59_02920 [Lentibacillus amyloliquefaciens]
MRNRRLLTLILLSVLLVLSACGGTDSAAEDNSDEATESPKTGLNEITLDDMITKKDNDEAFYFLIYDAKQEYVKNTKLLEAYDKALKDKDMTAYHININALDDENKQKVDTLSEEYESHSGSYHNPFEDGGIAAVHHNKVDSAYEYWGEAWSLDMLIEEVNSADNTFLDNKFYNDVKKEVQKNIDYINEQEIDLTY